LPVGTKLWIDQDDQPILVSMDCAVKCSEELPATSIPATQGVRRKLLTGNF